MTNFTINILNQEWISAEDSGYDLCSHGKFELIIQDKKILAATDELDWTVSTSTLNLLRCIESNHTTEANGDLILHCGELLMLSCPIGINLDLTHSNGKIKIENVKKQFGVSDDQYILYPNINTEISKRDFAIEILKVAKEVVEFFSNQPTRVFISNEDKNLWDAFWEEFNKLYQAGNKKYYC